MKALIYPYPTLRGGVEIRITEIRADGDKLVLEPAQLSESSLQIDTDQSAPWNRLAIEVEAQAQPNNLAAFEKEYGQVSLTLVASCQSTNSRQGVEFERSALDASRWSAIVELERNSFRERISVQAILSDSNADGPRPVAQSNTWALYVDPTDSFKIGGTLRVSWADFKSESAPHVARQFPDSPYVVDLERPVPEIFLNSSFDGLQAILGDKKNRTKIEKAFHESTRMGIARSVWMALLSDAMAAIPVSDDEEPDWPERSWQTEVLKRLLPEIDPNLSEAELLRLAANDWRRNPGSATFLSHAEAVIGELIQANKSLRKTVQTLTTEALSEGLAT